MVRKVTKKQVDKQLLTVLFRLEKDWKKIQRMSEHRAEFTLESAYVEKIARERYLFLLREARQRNLNALDF